MTADQSGEGNARAQAQPAFVHLRARTPYSLLEGAIRIPDLVKLCARHQMPAIGITDSGNLFGAMEVSEALAKAGIQPIIGCTLALAPASAQLGSGRLGPRRADRLPALALLAKDEAGYANLMKLSSKAFLETPTGEEPHITLDDLARHSEGLICLTGGPFGPVNRLIVEGHADDAEALLLRLAELFPRRLYVELQRHNMPAERKAEPALIDLAYARDLPLVATNEPYFATPGMHEAHDVLLCIADGAYVHTEERRRVTREHYFKSAAEMQAVFADLPEALESTVEIARRCAFRPRPRDPILPPFETTSGRSQAEELRHQAREGLKVRMAEHGVSADDERYWKRLDYELDVIVNMGFPGYFLIVSDFMKWAKARGIPVGVRGSGATSIVAWSLSITSLDPLRFDLVFERFLNPERVSMPDFDIDFCRERRGEVIAYVQEKYGHATVAQIITFGTLQARAAVRDVGRVLQMPYGQIDRICKMIPNQPGRITPLKQAIKDDPRLQQMVREDPQVASLMEIAQALEGLYRHPSVHAAGLVIGDRPLSDLVPLYRDPTADLPVTQFHYRDVEKAGLVKFDFLGLKTLTVIAKTEELLARRGIIVKTQDEVPFNDAMTFEMLARGDSIGVFQLEGAGMRDLMRQMKPDRIEDLIALVALYRPGPMDSIPTYIARKHGREPVTYLHPILEPILKETFGVITYQEDVMQIARDMAGYSLGEADLLRRAMGKKIPAEMEKHRTRFIEGAQAKGVPEHIASQVFELAAKFAGYGFNKGHAAAYAQVAYQTAYLKAHHPAEFIAASMTQDMERTDRLNIFRQEALRLGIGLLPPDVNRSAAVFTVEYEGDGTPVIPYALGAVKGVGVQAMRHVVEERERNGPYRDLFDFARRIDPRQINKRVIESLARAGAFDSLNPNRALVMGMAEMLTGMAAAAAEARDSSQESLFGGKDIEVQNPRLPQVAPWAPLQTLTHEMEVIGFYLSGHPLDDYAAALRRLRVMSYADLLQHPARPALARLAGTIIKRQDKKSQKTGNPFAVVGLSDASSIYEVRIFSELLAEVRDLLEEDRSIVLTVSVAWSGDEGPQLNVTRIEPIEEAVKAARPELRIRLDDPAALPGVKEVMAGARAGPARVHLQLLLADGRREVDLELPGQHSIDAAARARLAALSGVVAVEEV